MSQSCVYILKGDRYYVGSTNDIDRRLAEHKRGKTHTTKRIGNREPVKVINTPDLQSARKLEREIKKSLTRAKPTPNSAQAEQKAFDPLIAI